MSGQLEKDDVAGSEPSREEVLKNFKESFSSGKSSAQANDAPGPDKPSPGATGTTEPGKADAAAKPDGKAAGASDKPRDEKGKFATQPEPFDGFKDLKPEQQAAYKRLLGENEQIKNSHNALMNRVPAMQREVENLRKQLSKPQTAETQDKVQASLDKFEAFKARYPEDAEGVLQLVENIRQEVQDKLAHQDPTLTDEVAQLKSKLSEYERERTSQAAQREADRLSDEHPAWRQIAGWEDDDGNYVPDEPGKRQWHPWFTAWKKGLPSSVQTAYDRLLAEASADSIGHVLSHFERDAQTVMDSSGQTQSDVAEPEDDVSQRRADALRDTSPRPSRSGSEPAAQTPLNGSAQSLNRQSVLDRFYADFKAGRPLR